MSSTVVNNKNSVTAAEEEIGVSSNQDETQLLRKRFNRKKKRKYTWRKTYDLELIHHNYQRKMSSNEELEDPYHECEEAEYSEGEEFYYEQDSFLLSSEIRGRKRKKKKSIHSVRQILKKKACTTLYGETKEDDEDDDRSSVSSYCTTVSSRSSSCSEYSSNTSDAEEEEEEQQQQQHGDDEKNILSFGEILYIIQPLPKFIKSFKPRAIKRQFNKTHNTYINEKSRKRNIDKKLFKQGLKRIPPCYDPSMKYALNMDNKEIANIDDSSTELLIDLQYRDITPEDYELLLMLDQSVKPVVCDSLINQLPTVTKDGELSDGENHCLICLEIVMVGETAVTLPACKHEFHQKCIAMWLVNFSTKCPVDDIDVY